MYILWLCFVCCTLCIFHWFHTSMVAGAGETDWDLAATQFTKNCIIYNIT